MPRPYVPIHIRGDREPPPDYGLCTCKTPNQDFLIERRALRGSGGGSARLSGGVDRVQPGGSAL